jgi:hypothetical protein
MTVSVHRRVHCSKPHRFHWRQTEVEPQVGNFASQHGEHSTQLVEVSAEPDLVFGGERLPHGDSSSVAARNARRRKRTHCLAVSVLAAIAGLLEPWPRAWRARAGAARGAARRRRSVIVLRALLPWLPVAVSFAFVLAVAIDAFRP